MTGIRPRIVPLALAVLLVAIAAAPVLAQDDTPSMVTWIAYSTVRPNQLQAAVELVMEDREFLDGLMADGTILGWGAGTPINHSPDDTWNFVQWVHVADWSKADGWVDASFRRMQSRDDVTREALEARFAEVFVEGSHFDEVVRHDVVRMSPGDTPPRYLYVAEFAARPGKESALVDLFRAGVVPVVDGLVEEGTLTGYGVYSPELHLDVDWTHRFWYALPNLGSMDRMREAFGSMGAGFAAQAEDVFEAEGHHDKVVMILHLATPSQD